MYFTNASIRGPIRHIAIPWKVPVTESPNNETRIGIASRVGRTDDNQAVWSLSIRGSEIPGFWIVDGKPLRAGSRIADLKL